ncbi:MAG: hypothetical protein IKK02_03610 [Tidjanibacter sp.]|nr:hypothetical protein [Tidjanibacter sp.]
MKKVRYISLLLLALFVGKMVSDALLTHTHSYAWGNVTHSHPYSSKSHTHSAEDLLAIASANNASYIASDTTHITPTEQSEISIIWFYAEKSYTTTLAANNQRAPPALG